MNMKPIIIGFLALLYACTSAAQNPQYTFPNMPRDADSFYYMCPFSIGWVNGGNGDSISQWVKIQNIYRPFMFPGMPAGKVTSIYLRARDRSSGNPDTCIYDSFSVRMGYTEDTAYGTHNRTVAVPFLTGLTTVFQAQPFVVMKATRGTWVKIPLNKGNFIYNPMQNFVVEFRGGARGKWAGINFGPWAFNLPTERMLVNGGEGYDTTMNATKSIGSFPNVFAIGFDINPTGVPELSNIRGVGLFPNPAPAGRFNLSLDAKQPMKAVLVRISDVTGREVLSRQFANSGSSLFEEINLSGAAPGMYFVRITADGEAITRRVSVE